MTWGNTQNSHPFRVGLVAIDIHRGCTVFSFQWCRRIVHGALKVIVHCATGSGYIYPSPVYRILEEALEM